MAVLTDHRDGFCHEMGLPLSARFQHSEEEIHKAFTEVRAQHPEHDRAEAMGRALARLDALKHQKSKTTLLRVSKQHDWRRWAEIAAFVFLLLLAITRAHCQGTLNIRGIAKGTTVAASTTVTTVDGNHNALDVAIVSGGGTGGGPADTAASASASESDVARQKVTAALRLLDNAQGAGTKLVTWPGDQTSGAWVNCKSGCSGSSFADAAAFTFGTTPISLLGAVVDDVSTNAVSENSAGNVRMNGSRILYVDLSKTAANPTALKVDGSAVTQPVSAASLPLPSGAATEATLATRLADATVQALTKAANTPAAKSDSSLVVQDPYLIALLNQIFPAGAQKQLFQLKGPVSGLPVLVTNQALATYQNTPPPSYDECSGPNKANLPVSVTANSKLLPGQAGKRYRICSIVLVSTSAETFSIVEGTGAVCATGVAAVVGSTTAANGPSIAANQGYSQGNGAAWVASGNTPGNDVCILISGSTLIAGNLTYAF